MREVSPKELQKLNSKSFKNTQKIFRRRLREIAAGGENKAKYKPGDYCCGDRIADWLKSLGFIVKQINPIWCEVTWPEEEDIIERLHSETFKILTQPMPAKVRYVIGWLNREEKKKTVVSGEWTFNPHCYDYVCSECGKHSEYTSPYCPNCGKKLKPIEGKNYDTE